MSANDQNNTERILDQLERGLIAPDAANVLIVRSERVRIVSKLPRSVRSALNAGVKSGQLGHMRKDGLKPEVYYHPNFEHLAISTRNREAERGINALKKIYTTKGQ